MITVAMLIARIVSWQAHRTTVQELSRLSDRDLDDIGICRADIPAIARNAIERCVREQQGPVGVGGRPWTSYLTP